MIPRDDLSARVNNWMLLLFAGVSLLVYQFLAASLVLTWESSWALSSGIIVGVILGILLPFRTLARKLELPFRSQWLFGGFDLWTGFLVSAATLSLIPALEVITNPVTSYFPPSSEYFRFVNMMRPDGLWETGLIVAAIVVIVPIGEELLFRGLVMRVLFRHSRPALAVLLSGLLFGVIHPLFSAPAVALLGIWFGFLLLWGGNIWYPILAHGIWNLANLGILLNYPRENLEEAMASPFAGSPLLWMAISLLLFGFFAVISQRRLSE
jgi:membrane protease YdiL (CAAX protease family)